MKKKIQMHAFLLIIVSVAACRPMSLGETQHNPQPAEITHDVSHEIASAIKDLEHGEPVAQQVAIQHLKELPDQAVVEALVTALKSNPSFRNDPQRDWAYGLLNDHHAAKFDVGFEQLLDGVREPGRPRGLVSLTQTPPEKYSRLVTAIEPLLRRPELNWSQRMQVLRLLAQTGATAKPTLTAIEKSFRQPEDPADSEHVVRTYATFAMVQIGGVAWAFDRFQINQPEKHPSDALIPILDGLAMAGHASATEGDDYIWHFWSGTNPETRQKIKDLAIRSLKHADSGVRSAALEFIQPAFGEDLVVGESPDEFRIHPDVDAGLRSMMTLDRDPELREKAHRWLISGAPQIIDQAKRAFALKHSTSSP